MNEILHVKLKKQNWECKMERVRASFNAKCQFFLFINTR